MENYLEIFSEIFKSIIKKYSFKVKKLNSYTISLVRDSFEIDISISRDGTTLDYVTFNENKQKIKYNIDSFITSQFDSSDREGIGNPKTIYEIIIAELKITARGLENHFSDILMGDKKWLSTYEQSEYAREPQLIDCP